MRVRVVPSILSVLVAVLPLACRDGEVDGGLEAAGGSDGGRSADGDASAEAAAPSSRTVSIVVGAPTTLVQSKSIRQFPWVAASGDDVFIAYSKGLDGFEEPETPIIPELHISRDRGATFSEVVTPPELHALGLTQLQSGALMGIGYGTEFIDARRARLTMSRSLDAGLTWTTSTGVVTWPEDQGFITAGWGGLVFHRALIEEPDGTLYASMYGRYASDGPTRTRAVWIRSTDQGATWSVVSTISHDLVDGTYEPIVARVADGSLLAILRTDGAMLQTRSRDNGRTWSARQTLPGIDPALAWSVDPDLELMSNGVLVLSYGRPGAAMLFSPDGSGYRWERYSLIQAATADFFQGSTGYTGVRETGPDRVILVGDRGKFPELMNPPQEYQIWHRNIDVAVKTVPGHKLNLGAMHAAGKVTIATDMTYANGAVLPGVGIAAPLDGSTDYTRSAYRDTEGTPEYQLALDRPYRIRTIGVLLKVGYAETAEVYVSADGVDWGAPVTQYVDAIHTAVDYTTLDVTAQYVKVRFPNPGKWQGLNEIELFADDAPAPGTDGFEADAPGTVPAGYQLHVGTAATSDGVAAGGARSLEVRDDTAEGLTRILRALPVATTAQLEFSLRPVALSGGAVVDLTQGTRVGIHLVVTKEGAVAWYDGATWNPIAPAGTVQLDAWNRFRIEATSPSSAVVFLDGVALGAAGPSDAISAIDGVVFGTGGTATVGDDFHVDDLVVH